MKKEEEVWYNVYEQSTLSQFFQRRQESLSEVATWALYS